MAESSLSLAYADFKARLAVKLGLGRTSANWSTEEGSKLDEAIQDGYRQFLNPPVLQGEPTAHKWSFLEPVRELTCWATTTGTVSGTPTYASPISTITATTASFHPEMVGSNFTFTVSTNSYVIAGYTSSTVITVTGNASGEGADKTFTITSEGHCRLPDDFGNLLGEFTYDSDEDRLVYIPITSEGRIRKMLQVSDSTGTPQYAALRCIEPTYSTGQRWEAIFYPIPDEDYTLSYRSEMLVLNLSSSYPYPLGGMRHADTIYQSMRDKAAALFDDEPGGPEHALFLERLRASVSADRRMAPTTLGMMTDNSEGRTVLLSNNRVTYNGVQY